MTPGETMNRILAGAKPPLGEGEIRELAEKLEKVREHLLSIDRCVQPADDRCDAVCPPAHTLFLDPRLRSWVIPPSHPAVHPMFGEECMEETNPSQSKACGIAGHSRPRPSKR